MRTSRPVCWKYHLCRNGNPQDRSGVLMEREVMVSHELQPSRNDCRSEPDFVPSLPCLGPRLLFVGSWLSSLLQLLKSPELLVPAAPAPQSLPLSYVPASPKSSQQFNMVQACSAPWCQGLQPQGRIHTRSRVTSLFFFFNFCILFYLFFLYSRFFLVIHFIHISVYMSLPVSQFIPPEHPPTTLPPLFSTLVSLFLPCKLVFRGSTYMR